MLKSINAWIAGRPRKTPAPDLPLDPLSDRFIADPAPVYAHLRQEAPLAELKGGGYLLTRAGDIEAAFTDARLGNAPSRFSMLAERHRDRSTAANLCANIPPFQDMPRHAEVRRPLSSAFYRTFEPFRDGLPDLARSCLSRVASPDAFDVMEDFAAPFATAAMSRFLGIAADPAQVRTASAALFRLFAPIDSREGWEEVNRDLATARVFLDAAVDRRPGAATLIGELTASGALTPREVADNALLVLADGLENIQAGIALALYVLSDHAPGVRPDDLPALVDEALRLESPAQIIPRVVREEHDRHGVRLAPGTPLFLALGSANRDPDRFADPDRFDPARDAAAHFVFGRGRHSCIGAPLARAMIVAATGALLNQGVTPAERGPLRFQRRFGHRWPQGFQASRAR